MIVQILTFTTQAMISGVKAQIQTLDEIERLEEAGMEALRNRFVQQRLGKFCCAHEICFQGVQHSIGDP